MATKSEQLTDVLSGLRKTAGVEGSALLSRDGITVVADLPKSFNRETFSAMTAAMLGAAETALMEIGKDVPDRLILETNDSRLVAAGINAELMIVVLANGACSVAQISTAIKAVGDSIRRIVG